MNFFNFFITRKLVEDKTGDRDRANKLGLLTSMIPGPMGMMMGVLLADREQAAPRRDDSMDGKEPLVSRALPTTTSTSPTAR
jgi:hypothetical protein